MTIDVSGWSASTWYHILGTYNGSAVTLYIAGASSGTPDTVSGAIAQDVSQDLNVGAYGIGDAAPAFYTVDGLMDEVRISSTGATAAWAKAEYNSTGDTLFDWGDEECLIEITNSSASYNFGTVLETSTYATGISNLTLINTGKCTIDITISAGNMTGGTQWTLSDTCEPASMVYGLRAGVSP